jgi:hypothetical protein
MSQHLCIVALLLLALQPTQSGAKDYKDPDPLFASDALLEISIEAPFSTIMRDRPTEKYTPARLEYSDSGGELFEYDIGVRTRGEYRRRPDICAFAPLRLNFVKSQSKNTHFDHQDKLKLVTHCQTNSPKYDQYVINEYLAYRIFNLVTDVGFLARLTRITYIDTANDNRMIARLAIFLEHDDRLAKRINSAVVELASIKFKQIDPAYMNLVSVFQYLIGNTDFAPTHPEHDDFCCHNQSLFTAPEGLYFSIPYDFDMTGYVNPPHAHPGSRSARHNLRRRNYRGRCLNNVYLPTSVEKFFEQRDNIYELVNTQELMTGATRKSTLKFIDGFFKLLDTPEEIEKRLAKDCSE